MTTDNTQTAFSETESSTSDKPMMLLKGQYVKSVDFQGPNRSKKFEGEAKTNISFNLKTVEIENGLYEVDLGLLAEIGNDSEKVVSLNINYAALYQLSNIPSENQEPILMIEGPRLMYPYLQRIVSDLTRDGGLPPFSLPPIDFAQAYAESQKQKNSEK
jgi:preprotein translocase subunit SecB